MSQQKKLLSDPSLGTTARASSVLNKNSKLYGPMNVLDTADETSCWNSDAVPSGRSDDEPITFTIHFGPGRLVRVDEIRIQFQGGFVAEECTVHIRKEGDGEGDWVELEEPIEPEDVNDVQTFGIADDDRTCNVLKLSFVGSSDFYGRVTIYKLGVWGSEE